MIKSTTLSICHSSLVLLIKLKVKSSLLKLSSVLYVRINLRSGFKKNTIALKRPGVQVLTVCIFELKTCSTSKTETVLMISEQSVQSGERSDMYMRSRKSFNTFSRPNNPS